MSATVLNHIDQATSGGDNVYHFDGTIKRNGLTMEMHVAGNHVVTAGEATATTLTINTGLASISTAIVQTLDNTNADRTGAQITFAGNAITVSNAGAFTLAAGYIIRWIATGTA